MLRFIAVILPFSRTSRLWTETAIFFWANFYCSCGSIMLYKSKLDSSKLTMTACVISRNYCRLYFQSVFSGLHIQKEGTGQTPLRCHLSRHEENDKSYFFYPQIQRPFCRAFLTYSTMNLLTRQSQIVYFASPIFTSFTFF